MSIRSFHQRSIHRVSHTTLSDDSWPDLYERRTILSIPSR